MARLKPVSHEDRLTVVEHLDELRTRILVGLASFAVSFTLCYVFNHELLRWMNRPLHGREPVTFGVAEAFTTTITVVAYAALVLAMPVILYQIYAYVLPAFTPGERRVARPLLFMIPVLFVAGAAFGYFVVLPAAVKFLLNYNSDEFNTQIRAREYYSFVTLSIFSTGLVFQVPVAILAMTRLGIVDAQKLSKNRRYALLVCAVIAAALPGVDPVSMLIEMVPLVVLYELSILLAKAFGRRDAEVADQIAQPEGS